MTLATPNIVDVEASSLGCESYPIEIGVILHNGKRYCSLIKPHESWTDWNPEAENIHHISQSVLQRHGKPLGQVAQELNEFLTGETVYSDGWVVDNPWIKKLFFTANITPSFRISSLEMILKEPQMEIWHKTKEQILSGHEQERHRASYDAALIQETYMETVRICKL